jgi:hypothetical protein
MKMATKQRRARVQHIRGPARPAYNRFTREIMDECNVYGAVMQAQSAALNGIVDDRQFLAIENAVAQAIRGSHERTVAYVIRHNPELFD